jgi:hypothetical protein
MFDNNAQTNYGRKSDRKKPPRKLERDGRTKF